MRASKVCMVLVVAALCAPPGLAARLPLQAQASATGIAVDNLSGTTTTTPASAGASATAVAQSTVPQPRESSKTPHAQRSTLL